MMLSRFAKTLVLLSLTTVGVQQARAFSLAGPLAPWMATSIGYPAAPGPGPMNLGEGYRWNLPVITYAFDPSFLNYFGSNGVAAIQQAFQIMNDLPPASQIDVNQFPTYTTRINYRASSLLLLDVKSVTLWMLMEHVGLASPETYVWSLRNLSHAPGGAPFFPVIKRNFDPVTWQPSSYINGNFFTYYISYVASPESAIAIPVLVDPLGHNISTVASGMSFAGGFFSGLTRDDAGGIKYLYSKTHAAVETIPPNVQAPAGFNFTSVGGSSNSWFISNVGTNGTTDIGSVGSISVVGNSGGWFPVTITNAATATNATGTGTGTGTGAGTVNTNFVGTALRQGVDKLTFLRTDFDSVIGVFNVVTNQYIDTYVTNNTRVSQTLERVINSPDILISAGDLGLTPAPEQPIATFTTGPGANWQNNGALNTTPNTTPPNGEWDGPGMIITPQNFWFSKLGPNYWNGLAFLNEKDAQLGWGSFLMWGSYDGTTNDPVAYPSGTSLKDLESQIFGF